MSNMQDVPLAEPEGLDEAGGSSTVTPKSNSLKRFFKMSKKPNHFQDDLHDVTESAGRQKDPSKNNTVGRFFTRFKNAHKTSDEPSSSIGNVASDDGEEQQQQHQQHQQDQGGSKPMPNEKTTLKESISTYWKTLFNRSKAQKQADGEMPDGMEEEVHEMQPVKQDQNQSDELSDSQPDQSNPEEEDESVKINPPESAVALVGQTELAELND